MRDKDNPREDPAFILGELASAIDGEGCITIKKTKPAGKRKSPRYDVSVSITNTHYGFLRKFRDRYGGHINGRARSKMANDRNWKNGYAWEVTRLMAIPVLRLIQPVLTIKGRQALACLQLIEGSPRRGKRVSDEENLRRDTLWAYVQMLNRKGVTRND